MTESDSQYYPALWMINVDGEDAGGAWTDNAGASHVSVSTSLDTTRYPNGLHELYIAMHSNWWQSGQPAEKSWYNWRAGFEQVINIQNGHTLMDIAANYLHVYLRPGNTTTLSCRELFTDNKAAPCKAVRYTSSNDTVVTVSPKGVLFAGAAQGFATITMNDGDRATRIYVWVRRSFDIPHFSTAEEVHGGSPKRHIFITSPFALPARELLLVRDLAPQLHRAGINTLSEGFFMNPRNRHYSYTSWKQYYDNAIAPEWSFAKAHNFHVLATGDEVCRNIGGEAWWTLNWPAGKAAVQYALAGLAASGVAVAVDMVDEVNFNWGSTPAPPGKIGTPGSFSSMSCSSGNCTITWPNNPVVPSRFPSGTSFALANSRYNQLNTPSGQMFEATGPTGDSFNFVAAGPVDGTFDATTDPNLEFLWWAGNIGGCPTQPCDPPVPNDALLQINSWLHEVQPNVPVSWPVHGGSSISEQANWMGPGSISDYASHYWVPLKLRHTYTWGAGVQEQGYWMRQSFYESQSATMIDRPQLLLESVAGPMYRKNTAAEPYYTPPIDDLEQPGPTAPAITSSIMTAAALGAAGVRLYTFEDPRNEGARAAATIGSELQTGANPTANDPILQEHWRAMASASTAITKLLTPFVLGVALNSPAYGRNIVTAVRQASNGKMLMVVNDNDWARTLSINFTPYKSNFFAPTTRYLVNSDGITKASLPYSNRETITLAPGETAVYLFHERSDKKTIVVGWGWPASPKRPRFEVESVTQVICPAKHYRLVTSQERNGA